MKPCPSRSLVDRHFNGAISPVAEHVLRGHLAGCPGCRERYERYLLLGQLDPRMPSSEERLARGLGLSRRRSAWPRSAVLVLGLAAAVLLVLQPRARDQPSYLARGAAIADPDQALYIYRIAAGAEPRPVLDGAIRASDELAFAYRNRRGWPCLMVYALDEAHRVYWYHPAWTETASTPVAVPIEAGGERHELPDAIAQPLPAGRIQLHALFTDDCIDVRAVEQGRRPARAEDIVVTLDVTERTER